MKKPGARLLVITWRIKSQTRNLAAAPLHEIACHGHLYKSHHRSYCLYSPVNDGNDWFDLRKKATNTSKESPMQYIKIRFGKNLGEMHDRLQRTMDEMFRRVNPMLVLPEQVWRPQMDV